MRPVDWTDYDGRTWRSLIPEAQPDSSAPYGVPVGPPDLSSLGLPDSLTTRLHNELHRRQLWSWPILKHRRTDLEAAIRAAYSLSTASIVAVYYTDYQQGVEAEAERTRPTPTPNVQRAVSKRQGGRTKQPSAPKE